MYLFSMKAIACLLFLAPILAQTQHIKNYRWKNRVIVLVDNNRNSEALQEQLTVLNRYKTDLTDRDMIVFTPSGEVAPKILKELSVAPNFQGILLIGKDGGVKFQERFPVRPETLFALVDTMPMRQAEMKRKKGNR